MLLNFSLVIFVHLALLFLSIYFTNQFIFTTIYEFYCIFWYYLWVKIIFYKDGCKTYVLHNPISDCHVSILLKI